MLSRLVVYVLFSLCSYTLLVNPAAAQGAKTAGPRVLVVDAHPDDETAYAATIYKITHDLNGVVDLAVITNGEAGYKYSTLAEPYYHLKLTDEKIGRKYLPGIRKQELTNAGKIIGLHHIFFFDQLDNHYTQNQHEVLDDTSHVWNRALIQSKLKNILTEGHYDFVFTLLPTDSTHGHHKGATIMALTAVKNLPVSVPHPIVLGALTSNANSKTIHYSMLAGYPITASTDDVAQYNFNRDQSFGFHHVLNYKAFVNWEIAEHKSQGTLQLGMNQGDLEQYWYYDINPPEGRAKTQALFDKLAINTYPEVTYPGIK